MTSPAIYKVLFHHTSSAGQPGQIVELYARQVTQGNLFGFIEVEGLIFGSRTTLVVDPGEENLKSEFGEAKRLYLPLHTILRIEEVEREGVARIRDVKDAGATVTPFPVPLYTPRGPKQ